MHAGYKEVALQDANTFSNPALGLALNSARGPGPMANAVQRFGKSHDDSLASYGLKTSPAVPTAWATQAVQKQPRVSASQVGDGLR